MAPLALLFSEVHVSLCPFMAYGGSFNGLVHFLWFHLNVSLVHGLRMSGMYGTNSSCAVVSSWHLPGSKLE